MTQLNPTLEPRQIKEMARPTIMNTGGTHEGPGQEGGRAGPVARGRARARAGHQRRADQGQAHRHLRHRSAHLQMGRVGAEDDSRADGGRPRIRRRDRRGRRQRQRLRARHDRLGRGPYRLRPLPQLHGRPAPPVPVHQRRRRQPRRRLRRIYRHPQRQRLAPCRRHRSRRRLDLRSVRQRRPHRAAMGHGRRGRADHRRRPDRRDGRGGRPPCRRPPRRHHRRQRLSPRARREARRHPDGQCRAARRSPTSRRTSA